MASLGDSVKAVMRAELDRAKVSKHDPQSYEFIKAKLEEITQ